LDETRRKAEQGSQQIQGEVLETTLEDLLRQQFPFDEITPVPKGVHGGDVVQTVRDASGTVCGIILWESKRTKTWSDGWLPKLRDDQRAAKAQIAILVSLKLPKDVTTFRHIDGVWVSSVACAVNLAHALQAGSVELGAANRSLGGRHDKIEMLNKNASPAPNSVTASKGVLRRLNPEETMVRVSTTRTEVSRGQNPVLKTLPFLAA
jgi:hypothetical protein